MITTTPILPEPINIPSLFWLHPATNRNSCKECRSFIRAAADRKTREISFEHLRDQYKITLFPNDGYCRRNYLDEEGVLRSCYFTFWQYEIDKHRPIDKCAKEFAKRTMPKSPMPKDGGTTLRFTRHYPLVSSVDSVKIKDIKE